VAQQLLNLEAWIHEQAGTETMEGVMTMDWGLISWGLLIGMAGMVWMLVLAIWQESSHEKPSKVPVNPSEENESSHEIRRQQQIEAA
jgi:hypothetical protein